MTADRLIEALTEVIDARHFDEQLYNRAFRALRELNETNKLTDAIANSLEEYYNYHNRRSLFRKSPLPIAPQAEDEREELMIYREALRQGITDFESPQDLRFKLSQDSEG